MLKRIGWGLLMLLLLVVLAVAINTFRNGSRQLQVAAITPLAVDEQAAAESLAVAIRARTVSSRTDPEQNADQFAALQAHLAARYPKVHAALKREVIGGLSLLYTWPGSEPSLKGIALMAHQDVVPIAPGTEGDWQAAPFGGEIKDGFVWGRGAWDDKSNLVAQFEALEALVASGFAPKRTVYLISGADEEVAGLRGASQIAKLLAERGVKLDFVIDEGLLITLGIMPGLKTPAALIGIAEKGFATFELKVKGTPGHSSMPPGPGQSAIGQLSQALAKLDLAPLPAAVSGVAAEMFDTVGPEMGVLSRIALSNRWLFGTVLQNQLEKSPGTNAMMRTTTALTIFNAGSQDNVLPGRAAATVNFRILPGDSIDMVKAHVQRTIVNDNIELSLADGASEPSKLASSDSTSYRAINRTVRELFPDTIVAPGLMLGGTDARYFEPLADQVFRFSPVKAKAEDLTRFHGTNERMATVNLVDLIRFYHRLVQQSASQ